MQEPEFTFPPEVAEFVREQYAKSNVILEYGSGGSTVLAARLEKRVFSVESDRKWAANLSRFLETSELLQHVNIHYVDIGETIEWGMMKEYKRKRIPSYLSYGRSVWIRPNFEEPDLILIDGRFRIGCLLVSLSRIKKPTMILFDDYLDRTWYRNSEEFARPDRFIGRMAVFEVQPTRFSLLSFPKRLQLSQVPL